MVDLNRRKRVRLPLAVLKALASGGGDGCTFDDL